MESEMVELSQSKVWISQSYLRCLQCCGDPLDEEHQANATQLSTAFDTNTENCPYQWKHEYQMNITRELKYFLGSQ